MATSTKSIIRDGRIRKLPLPLCDYFCRTSVDSLPASRLLLTPASILRPLQQCAPDIRLTLVTFVFITHHELLKLPQLILRSWDDWVEEDRLRKLTQENRELANSLRHAVLEQQRAQRAQAQPVKKKTQTSTRGSEERQTPVQAAPPRGQKRMRDQDLEKVSVGTYVPGNYAVTPTKPCDIG